MKYLCFEASQLGFHTLVRTWFLYFSIPSDELASPSPAAMMNTGVTITCHGRGYGYQVCSDNFCESNQCADFNEAVRRAVTHAERMRVC